MSSKYRVVEIRGNKTMVYRSCPHLNCGEQYHLPNDHDLKFNGCVLCAAEAASQVDGGLTYQEIADLLGISKMYVAILEKKAIDKIKKRMKMEEMKVGTKMSIFDSFDP